MIFGRSPAINRGISVGCYTIGFIIMTVNIFYSQRYFDQALKINGDLQWWTTWTISAGMGAYEATLIGIGTTPFAWGYFFDVPKQLAKIQDPLQRKIGIIASGALAVVLVIMGLIVYWTDYTTTMGGLGLGDILPARFLAWSLVIGSEIMFLAGNTLGWLALIGAAATKGEKEKLQQAANNSNGRSAGNTPVSLK